MDVAHPAGVAGEVWHAQHHGQLLVAAVPRGHLHHHRLAALHEQRRDEHEEDVVEEEGAEEDSADLEAGQAEHLQHVDAEHDAEDVLQHPAPVRLAEHEPGGRGRDGGRQQQELSELELEDADVEVAARQPQHGQPREAVARHHERLEAAVHGEGARDAEHRHDHVHCNGNITCLVKKVIKLH